MHTYKNLPANVPSTILSHVRGRRHFDFIDMTSIEIGWPGWQCVRSELPTCWLAFSANYVSYCCEHNLLRMIHDMKRRVKPYSVHVAQQLAMLGIDGLELELLPPVRLARWGLTFKRRIFVTSTVT